jgi:hypothetical protein
MHGQEDLPEQEDPIRHWPRGYMPGIYFPDRYAPDRYDPDRYALDRRTPDRYREQGPPEPYLPGRERHTPWKKPPKRQELQPQGEEGAPAELSRGELQYQLELAVNNLQKARREFKGARILTQSEIHDLPRPVTEVAKGVAAAQKLVGRTRALKDAIQAYRNTYEKARKAGVTEGGEQTADFTEREDDGYPESEEDRMKESGKAGVAQDWDGLYIISQEASPTPKKLARSLMRLLSPRLGEDSTHVAEASSRNRNRIDDFLTEGYNLREEGSFPEADADELVLE